jgi:hypothetical protein
MSRSSVVPPPLGLLVVLAAGCAGHAPPHPWLAPHDRFFDQTHTVALASVDVPDGLEQPAPVVALFDSLIAGRLREAGYDIVPASDVNPIWRALVDSAGGLFDQTTGRPDTIKARALHDQFLRQLRSRFHVDAIVYPRIVVVGAGFNETKAKWDGVSQSIEGTGSALLRALAGVNRYGETEALSLQVSIEDMGGTDVYSKRGGLEVWAKPARNGFQQVPRSALFQNAERNARGVEIALEPVLMRGKVGTRRR